MEILHIYEENNFEVMEKDFRCKIIPNLINELQARSQMEELIHDSRNTIGSKTSDEMLALTDNAAFFTAAVRYAILSDHEHSGLFSPDLSDTIQNSRLPSITEEFVVRKNELKKCGKLLQERPTLFISGVAGIRKSEFAKYYADKNRKKYTMQVLSAYENLVLEHEGTHTLDNEVCQMMYGAIALSKGNAKEAELHLLSAENIIAEVMGTDNDYAKTVYLYLNNLYARWQKPEQALTYKNKYIECSHHRQ